MYVFYVCMHVEDTIYCIEANPQLIVAGVGIRRIRIPF